VKLLEGRTISGFKELVMELTFLAMVYFVGFEVFIVVTEEYCLLGCGTVQILCELTFLQNVGSRKFYTAPHPRRYCSSMVYLFCQIKLFCDTKFKVSDCTKLR
jgi:hypothetical protein